MAVFEINVNNIQITGSSSSLLNEQDFNVPAPKSVYVTYSKETYCVYDYGAVVYLEQHVSLVLILFE